MTTLSSQLQSLINNIPNAVSGDGKTFVTALKKLLSQLNTTTNNIITCKEQVTSLALTEIDFSTSKTNIRVTFDSSPVTDYAGAQIWYKEDADGTYKQAGNTNGNAYVIESVNANTTYYVKVVAINSSGGSADFDTAPEANISIKGMNIVPGVPTQFVLTWDDNGQPLWQWLYEKDEYTDFFELRLDTNVGTFDSNCLDRTRDLKSTAVPTARSGTAYLYVRNVFGTYGTPATHIFSKEQPTKPNAPTITSIMTGVQVNMDALPANCTGYKVVIDDTDIYELKNSPFTLFRISGNIKVKYCFIDDLGDGEYSEEIEQTIKSQITEDDIEDGAIVENKIAANAVVTEKLASNSVVTDKLAAGAVTAPKIYAEAVTTEKLDARAVTTEKMSAGCVTTDILSAGAVNAAKLAAGAVTTEKLYSGAVSTVKLAAGAVTADKMTIGSLSAITATIGTLRTATSGARLEIRDNLITVYDSNNVLRLRMGVW